MGTPRFNTKHPSGDPPPLDFCGALDHAVGLPDPPPFVVTAQQGASSTSGAARSLNKLRYMKVLKFWEKKSRRCFEKKIVSKKRKKVADNKLRIQGKFVTIEQAIKLVGKRQVNKMLKEAQAERTSRRKKSKSQGKLKVNKSSAAKQ